MISDCHSEKIIDRDIFAYIYCPCKPSPQKAARMGEISEFFVWGWLFDKDDRARCRFCKEFVQFYTGDIPSDIKPEDYWPHCSKCHKPCQPKGG